MDAARSSADFTRLHTLPPLVALALLGLIVMTPSLVADMPDELRRLVDAAQLELATIERCGPAMERLCRELGDGDRPWWPPMPLPEGPLFSKAGAFRFELDVPVFWGLSDVQALAQHYLQQAFDHGDLVAVRRYAGAAGAVANIRRLIGDAIGGRYASPSAYRPLSAAKIKESWVLFAREAYKLGLLFMVPMPTVPASAVIVPGPGVPRGPRLVHVNREAE